MMRILNAETRVITMTSDAWQYRKFKTHTMHRMTVMNLYTLVLKLNVGDFINDLKDELGDKIETKV